MLFHDVRRSIFNLKLFRNSLLMELSQIDSPKTVLLKDGRTHFIIGRDFIVTRSSSESCCDLFVIASAQTAKLKWLPLNKHNR